MENRETLHTEDKNIQEETVMTDNKVTTTGRMFTSTKDTFIEIFKDEKFIAGIEGKPTEQKKFEHLAKMYNQLMKETKDTATEQIASLDLTTDLRVMKKILESSILSTEAKIASYVDNTIIKTASSTEKSLEELHEQFMQYLKETQETAVASVDELKEKTDKLEEKDKKINELETKVEELEVIKDKLEKTKVEDDEALKSKAYKIASLEEDIKSLSYTCDSEHNTRIRADERSLRFREENNELIKKIEKHNQEIEFKTAEIDATTNKNKELEVKNTGLETKVKSLLEENKQILGLKEEIEAKGVNIAQLKEKNASLSKDAQLADELKKQNIVLEGNITALENQNKTLQDTLSIINSTISTMAQGKAQAESKTVELEESNSKLIQENSRLLKEIELLNEQLKNK